MTAYHFQTDFDSPSIMPMKVVMLFTSVIFMGGLFFYDYCANKLFRSDNDKDDRTPLECSMKNVVDFTPLSSLSDNDKNEEVELSDNDDNVNNSELSLDSSEFEDDSSISSNSCASYEHWEESFEGGHYLHSQIRQFVSQGKSYEEVKEYVYDLTNNVEIVKECLEWYTNLSNEAEDGDDGEADDGDEANGGSNTTGTSYDFVDPNQGEMETSTVDKSDKSASSVGGTAGSVADTVGSVADTVGSVADTVNVRDKLDKLELTSEAEANSEAEGDATSASEVSD